MGGFFGAVSKKDCVLDIFFGVDYHSHLSARRGGMVVYDEVKGFTRQIHNIESSPFRTKFEGDLADFKGNSGIGCISDTDPQPLVMSCKLGTFAVVTVGLLTNIEELKEELCVQARKHFLRGYESEKALEPDYEKRLPLMRRFCNLFSYARLIRCIAEEVPNAPEWMVSLKARLTGKIQQLECLK